ncbi:MAG: endolytic transglycosylase MltG, partial [Oscillospiraceae bacterium]|nr:endolytic transglycosylase MltG [Oscillospiraceae bacterium]
MAQNTENNEKEAYKELLASVNGEDAPAKAPQPARRPQEEHRHDAHRSAPAQKKRKKKKKHGSGRIFGVLIMLTLIFVISITLAVGIIEVGKDMLGINGTETLVIFNIPEGANTAEIAEDLHEQGIIEIPKAFIYFSRLSKADANYIAGDHEVSSAMAYEAIINELTGNAITPEMTVVDVTFPEGCTLMQAARKLEENNVCDAQRCLYYFNAGG